MNKAEIAGCQTLAELLHPVEVEGFLATTWGQNYLHVRSENPSRFECLFPWDAVNAILEQHRLDPPRIRLAKESANIPAASFITSFTDSRGSRINRVRPVDVQRHIEQGATLVLDCVDELYRPLSQLAFGLEQLLGESIQINAYLGAKALPGFETHWDTHDVLILQVFGNKNWRIFGMARKYALAGDAQLKDDIPAEPLWAGTLNPGDLLYIPRAWWHDASAAGEPTLHLTIGISNATGQDFVNWIAGKLRECEIVRRDLPRFMPEAAQNEHLSALRSAISSALESYDLDAFFGERRNGIDRRAHSALPWTLAPDRFDLEDEQRVRFAFPEAPNISVCKEGAKLRAKGNEWNLSREMAMLLRELSDGEWHCISKLRTRSSSYLDAEIVSPLILELLRQGLLELER